MTVKNPCSICGRRAGAKRRGTCTRCHHEPDVAGRFEALRAIAANYGGYLKATAGGRIYEVHARRVLGYSTRYGLLKHDLSCIPGKRYFPAFMQDTMLYDPREILAVMESRNRER